MEQLFCNPNAEDTCFNPCAEQGTSIGAVGSSSSFTVEAYLHICLQIDIQWGAYSWDIWLNKE